MQVSDFNFHLPEESIAQKPLGDRAASRMLTLDRKTGAYEDHHFREFPEMLREGDVLVLNNSRVIPARLFAHRAGLHTQEGHKTTGRIQVLLTEQISEWEWRVLARPGRKVLTGEKLTFGDHALCAEVIAHGEFGERTIRFEPVVDFYGVVENLGHIPLPPYIHRQDETADRDRYQTVYAESRGSVAAPTAGLHFTSEILQKIAEKGVQIAYVTLHVGLGTFQPVRVDKVEDIHLHTERYTLPETTAEAINAAKRERRRVVAAGTTTVRTLEHCASIARDGRLEPHSGATNIFISPGYEFRIVEALLTNFHLPQSTLLMLVSAFGGREHVLAAYKHAVETGYRFFSYGDCMFLSSAPQQ
ncbi:tRNA preQ1(34) S-adenosylmethionine ribosyltransferase-isomerase QueA [Alloacidobacterium dinghuense]|uniref:S-adenosylmethionine:tRNA ribosyltransferase-isomerase n=1 Tax=Alloacidobacterium dinghuense TaxID=2763107 RepID=A0A7G8BL59_9BACT|nr:tRNA preQ1(34) S-adenosylmethionine ribosyltransferase-isomerase QueA [Alloacidobacterium dinghuense]QNI33279.1 tRNA preQ1(34) S-adenosylmethionine ribosyltransferase-isomerase QueA [Alloacidobacterium dinghuense]